MGSNPAWPEEDGKRVSNRKIITAFLIVCSIVVWFYVRSILEYFYVHFYQVRRFPAIHWLRDLLPLGAGVAVFLYLSWHKRVGRFLDEVVSELRKVTWPGRDEVVKSTVVVIVCILIASGILAIFDLVWGKLISALLQV